MIGTIIHFVKMNNSYSSQSKPLFFKERTNTALPALLLVLLLIISQQSFTQVSVTATAGTTGPTSYTTVNAAFTAINAGTHQGVITITVTANTTEPATPVPLLKSATPSNYTKIRIKPSSSGIVINSAATPTTGRGIIELMGADNVTIDGCATVGGTTKDLTIQSVTATTTGQAVIRLSSNSTTGTDGADNDSIINCNIIGARNSATSTVANYGIVFSNSNAALVTTLGAYSSINTVIQNNSITRCYYGIYAQGTSATYPNTGTQILGNTIGSATSASNVGNRGIYLSYTAASSGGAIIDGNDIRVGDYGTTGFAATIAGIEVGTVNYGVIIRKNNIHDINQPSTSGFGAHGIYITGSTNNTLSTIENNFITDCKMVVYQTSATSTFIPCGVFFTAGATGVNFNHNTIVMNTQLGAGANFSSFCVNASVAGVRFTNFYNNILVNNATSTFAYGFYTSATLNISGGSVNNNNYYVPGGHVGYYNAANRTTLSAWQTATSKDAAAQNANPPFVSTTDLHLNNAGANVSNFDQQGSTSAGVTTDIDGQTRPNSGTTIPDIGADEVAVITPPVITFNSITPSTTQCTASARAVSVDVTTPSGTVSGVTITYNNGTATGPVAMTNTTGNTWTYTIPAASPTNTNVTWSITATNSLGGTKTYTGTSYQDDPNFGINGVATASVSSICSGSSTSLSAVFSSNKYANSFETGITDFATSSVSGTPSLTQNATYYSSGTKSMYFNTASTSADVSASLNSNVNLSGASSAVLTFSHIAAMEGPTTSYDYGYVQYSTDGGGSWTSFPTSSYAGSGTLFNSVVSFSTRSYANWITAFTGTGSTPTNALWQNETINIPVAALTSQFRLRFRYTTDASTNYYGWLIDNINIVATYTPTVYSWSDGTSTVGSTNPLSVSPTTNTTYTCTATINSCQVVSNSVAVTVTSVSAPTANVSSSTQCGTAVPTVSVSGTAANMRWYSASSGGTLLQTGGLTYSTAISTTTTFYVSQVSGSCESTTRTPLTVTVNSPDPIQAYLDGSGTSGGHVSAPSDTICLGDTKHMYVIKSSGTTNTYSYTWTCGTSGNGLPGTTTVDNLDVTPTIAGTYTYTVTGVDGTCTTTSTTTLVVNTPLSALSYSSGASVSYCSGVAITNNTPTITGTPTSYSVSPALPTGLTLNATTGVISGTPSATSSATNYTITARNGGCTTSYVLNITVISPISGLSYTTPVTYCNNIAITPNTPTITGTPTSYSISPALPTGLSLNATTGEITGTPTVVSAATNYTVTASNGGCITTAVVNVRVIDIPSITTNPANISVATGSNATFTVAASNTPTSYLWEVNSGSGWSTVTNGGVYSGATTATLTITAAPITMTGYQYRATAINVCGNSAVSTAATLTVTYCTSNPTSNDGSGITGVTVGSATFSVADVTYYNYTGSIPDLTQGTSITSSITFATGYTYDSHIWIDFNDDGIFDNATEKVFTGVSTATNPTTLNTTFSLSASAALGQHKMRIGTADAGQATPTPCYSGTFGVTIDMYINVVAPTTCTGTPSGGTVTVSPSSGASGSTYGVSASGFSTSTGITYQWQYSDDGTTWTNQGASSSTYAALTGLTAPAFGVVRSWRLVVTCTNSGLSSNSTVGTFTSTYCTSTSTASTGFINSFSTTGGISNITNNTTGYTTGGYTNYTAQSASQYLGSTVNISISLGSGTGLGTGIAIYIDWNQDGDFIDAGELVYSPGYSYTTVNTGSFTVPASATLGNTRMRVVTNYNAGTPASCNSGITGETEDYTFTVVALPACSGSPTAGTATITSGSSICVSGTATITASGYTTGASGLSYNWQSAPDVSGTPGTFADISGATTPATYTSGTLTSNTWFRLRVTCSNSTSTTYTSTPVLTTITNPTITNTTPDTICGSGTVTLGATGSAGTTLKWYAASNGGTSLGTGTSFTTPSISSTTTYYVAAEISSSPQTITIGSGASTTSGSGASGGSYISPFSHYFGGYKAQYLIKASELIAAGFSAGNLSSMSYYVTSVGTTYNGFEINIGNSSATALTTTYETPSFTTVYSGNLTPTTGTFTIPFSSNFYWNGSSNIVVQVCWSNNNTGGTASEVKYDATSFVALNYNYYDSYTPAAMCAVTSATSTKSNRPQLGFNGIPLCSSSPRTPVVATVITSVLKPTARPDTSVCVNSTVKLYVGGSSISSSDTLLNQNFNSTATTTLPSGWTTSLPYSDVTMEVAASTNAGGTTNELDIGGGFNTSASGNFTLTLPAFNASTVLSGLQLSLKHMIDHYSSSYSYTLKIQSSTNGSTWTDRWSSGVVTADVAATTLNVDLSSLSGQSTVYIRFLLTGNAFGLSDWYIDDMVVSGNISVPAYYTWSPTTDLYVDATASTAYNPTVHTNKDTLYAKPSDTITYIVSASSVVGLPSLCPSNDTVVINVSQIPTASIDAVQLFACDASAKLSLSSLNPSSSTVNWTRTAGSGSATATGNPTTVSGLSAGTNSYNVTATNGACIDKSIGSVTVTMPTVSTTSITSSSSCNYCIYNDGNLKSLYNESDGKLIATIEDDATVTPDKLDETQICVRFDPSVQTVVDNLGNNQPYLQRQWTIHPANGTKAKVTLFFTNAELSALQTAANSTVYQFSGYNLWVTKYSGGQDGSFTPPASTGGVYVPSTFSAYGSDHKVEFVVDNFSTFYIHPSLFPFSALPVEFVSFTGWNSGNVNQLQWKTASESNTLKYIIEKSLDGRTYTAIGEKPAAGNSSQLLTYDFTDNNPVIGNNYYRLKVIDIDSKFNYSNVVNIPISEAVTNNFTRVYPNPTSGKLNVDIQSTSIYDTKVIVYDVVGNNIFEQNTYLVKGLNTLQFDFPTLAKGTYILSFTDSIGKSHITKFVKD